MPHYNALLWRGQGLTTLTHRESAKAAKKPGRKQSRLPISQILEARSRHEFAAWTPYRLANHYDVDLPYMRRVLAYEIASREYPKLDHINLDAGDFVLDTRFQDSAFGIASVGTDANITLVVSNGA